MNPCPYCQEEIEEGEPIREMVHADETGAGPRPYHEECFMRMIVGSVGHQSRRCVCFGGNEEDPPGATPREAAKAAFCYWLEHREVYTHQDAQGLLWRFEGVRPISQITDEVMRDVEGAGE